jgi:hypothetical protein
MNEKLLSMIFDKEDKTELRDGLKQIILDAFDEDMREYLSKAYLLNYEEFFDEIVHEASEEVKGKIKDALVDKMMREAVDKLGVVI